jgi:hypothetical protein
MGRDACVTDWLIGEPEEVCNYVADFVGVSESESPVWVGFAGEIFSNREWTRVLKGWKMRGPGWMRMGGI